MRQLFIQLQGGQAQRAIEILERHQAVNVARLEATGPHGGQELVMAHLSNHRVGPALAELEGLPALRVSFLPHGAIALHPPSDRTPEQVQDVSPISPLEVFVSGLQSIGSWRAFLGYAAISGLVAWIGLYTDTVYLLVAAMLIAPYTSPAMNLALGSARGDGTVIRHSLGRYFASLGVSIGVAWLMTLLLPPGSATRLMTEIANVSELAVALPLLAGMAGALHLVHSERNSLVSGAAVGLLVAASLAPPAALIGMGLAMGRRDLAIGPVFLLLLQVSAINLVGAIVFRAYGLSPEGARFRRGTAWRSRLAWGLSVMCLGGLLAWQFGPAPGLQHRSVSRRATSEVERVVAASRGATLVEASARYPRGDRPSDPLLVAVTVQRTAPASAEALKRQLTLGIRQRLVAMGVRTPLVDVTVLEGPPADGSG